MKGCCHLEIETKTTQCILVYAFPVIRDWMCRVPYNARLVEPIVESPPNSGVFICVCRDSRSVYPHSRQNHIWHLDIYFKNSI